MDTYIKITCWIWIVFRAFSILITPTLIGKKKTPEPDTHYTYTWWIGRVIETALVLPIVLRALGKI